MRMLFICSVIAALGVVQSAPAQTSPSQAPQQAACAGAKGAAPCPDQTGPGSSETAVGTTTAEVPGNPKASGPPPANSVASDETAVTLGASQPRPEKGKTD